MTEKRMSIDSPLTHGLLLAIALGIFLAITLKFVDLPFVWRYDYPSAHNSTNAIDHIQYGLSVTKGALVRNANPTVPEHLVISTHHPPLLSLLVAASYAVFGIHEAAARGLMVFFSALNILLLYGACRLLIDKTTALISTLIFALLPLQIIYATKVNFEPMILTFVLGALVAYGLWLRHPSISRFAILATSYCLGCAVDWGGYYIGGILPAFHFLNLLYQRKEIHRSDYILWTLPLLGVAMFALFIGHLYWVDPQLLHQLGELAAKRSGFDHAYNVDGFSNFSLLERTISRSASLFTFPVFLLGIAGLLFSSAKLVGTRRGTQDEAQFILLLWVLGVTHLVVFRHVYWVHEFLVHTLMVPFAVSAGWLIGKLPRLLTPRKFLAALVIFTLCFLPLSLLESREKLWDGQIAEILKLSKFLNKAVPRGAIIFTTASHHPFLHPAVPHYARRDVLEDIETVKALQDQMKLWPNSPKYLMIYTGPSTNTAAVRDLAAYMANHYQSVKTPWGLLYKISDPSSDTAPSTL